MVLLPRREYRQGQSLPLQHCELYEARFELQLGDEAVDLFGQGGGGEPYRLAARRLQYRVLLGRAQEAQHAGRQLKLKHIDGEQRAASKLQRIWTALLRHEL